MSDKTCSDPAAVARRFYDALGTGDLSLVDVTLGAQWESIPALRTGGGPDGWKASISHLRGVFTGLTVTIDDVVASGDLVAVRTTNRGTHAGELLGVAATGKLIEFRASDVHRFEDGLIVQTWHLEDYFGIALQLGLSFAPALSPDATETGRTDS
ncbi:ester cyclase [Humibacter antri]